MKALYKFLADGMERCDSLVMCPTCGEYYTHHMGVEVITRHKEDDKTGTRVTVRGHHVAFGNNAELRNPSMRRDGVVIRFSCELGCDDFILTFAQHKGMTLVDCDILTGQGNEWFRQGGSDAS